MNKFRLIKVQNVSVNRNIRLKKSNYDKISTMSLATGISFNRIVEKCIEFAFDNMGKK